MRLCWLVGVCCLCFGLVVDVAQEVPEYRQSLLQCRERWLLLKDGGKMAAIC